MPQPITIVQAIQSPKLFGSLPRFRKLDSWTSWLVVLKAIFGLEITAQELLTFQRYTGRSSPSRSGYSADEQGHLDQKSPVTCPACGHAFVPR